MTNLITQAFFRFRVRLAFGTRCGASLIKASAIKRPNLTACIVHAIRRSSGIIVLVAILSTTSAFADIKISNLDDFSSSLAKELSNYFKVLKKAYGEDTGIAVFQGAVRYWRNDFYKQFAVGGISFTLQTISMITCISHSMENLERLNQNTELKKFPPELVNALTRFPACYGSLDEMVALCLELDKAYLEYKKDKYRKDDSVALMSNFLEFASEARDNRHLYSAAIDVLYSDYKILPQYENSVFLFALYDAKPDEALSELKDFGNYLLASKKYGTKLSTAVLKAYSRKARTREELLAYVDTLQQMKYPESYNIALVEAFGRGSSKVYGGVTFMRNDPLSLSRILLKLHLMGDMSEAAITAIIEASALYPFYNGRWETK